MFLKTYKIEFDESVIAFTDQNGRPLEIIYSIALRTRKYVKGMDFYHLQEIYQTNIKNNYLIQD